MAITLLRHGVTKENKQKQYIGWSDVSLAKEELGRLSLAKGEGYPNGDLYVTSDLKRCKETLVLLYDDPPFLEMKEFREMHFGIWEGRTYKQLKEDSVYQSWLDDYYVYCPPNGESFCDFTRRVESGWERLMALCLEKKINHVVLVTHGGVIRYLLEQYAPYERAFWEWGIPFGAGYTLGTNESLVRGGRRCISLQEEPFKGRENG